MTDPRPLSDLLGAAAESFGLEDPRAVASLWRRWAEVVGDHIAAHAEPTSLRDGVLKVRADSPVWATEITYLAEEIRSAIERELGPGSVRSVTVWTGPGSGRRASAPGPGPSSPGPRSSGSDPAVEMSPEEALTRARTAWSKGRSQGLPDGARNPENRR